MTDTSFAEFAALAKQGTFVPVCKEVMAGPPDTGIGLPQDR